MNRRTAFAAAALVLVACAKPVPPRLTPLSARVTAVSTAGIDVEIKLDAENPNAAALTARSITATITLDGRYLLGTVTVPHRVSLPAHSTTTIDVPVSSRWADLAAIVNLATSGKDVPYKVEGTMDVGGDTLSVSVPFEVGGIVTRAQLTQAMLKSLPQLPMMVPGAH
ncbi:MAG: LEA type 2 family protein [Byssovorax sp.]